MKSLVFLLAMITAASAQQMPVTIKIFNNANGETVGTATTMPGSGTFYLRDSKGELLGTMILNKDNTRTFYDPSGKEIDTLSVGDLKLPTDDQLRQ